MVGSSALVAFAGCKSEGTASNPGTTTTAGTSVVQTAPNVTTSGGNLGTALPAAAPSITPTPSQAQPIVWGSLSPRYSAGISGTFPISISTAGDTAVTLSWAPDSAASGARWLTLDSSRRLLVADGTQRESDFVGALKLRATDAVGNLADSAAFNVSVVAFEAESPAPGVAWGGDIWNMSSNAKMNEMYAPQMGADGVMGTFTYWTDRNAPGTPDGWARTVENVARWNQATFVSLHTPIYGGFMRPIVNEQFGDMHFLIPG